MKPRRSIKPEDIDAFVETVLERYKDDLLDRADWAEARLQRYAKLYGWLEVKNYPWPNASNQHVPMLMTNSQRTQDTLHNAVMSSRPVVSATAINSGDKDKGTNVDELQDYQFFVEQPGEEKLGSLIDSFVNDSRFVAFMPWVKEKRKTLEIKPVPYPVVENVDMSPLYEQYLGEQFPGAHAQKTGDCKYTITAIENGKSQEIEAEFYEDEEDRHFVALMRERIIFDGPCVIPKPLEDIICPSRCENLQPPGPSNPLGADHVIMVDWPQYDEIWRLYKSGYYDLLTKDQADAIKDQVDGEVGSGTNQDTPNDPEQQKIQKDALAGQQHGNAKTTSKEFTRLTYFGRWDLDGDGFEEEIVARVIRSANDGVKALCRLRRLEEEYPRQDLSRPRPFACSPAFIPIPGQWFGIGMLELLEAMYELTKILLDQMIDKHTLSNTPFGFYRASSGVRPEKIGYQAGMLYPVNNPQQDIVFPQMPIQDQTIALNLIAMVGQWAERQSMQGALQMGSVPQGKASALRTSSNMMSVLQQGDARPERILRRFFRGLCEMFQQMHELNKVFLPPNKQYRVTGVVPAGADPYKQVNNPQDIGGMFQFDFKANAINTSKAMLSQVLGELLPTLVNGLMLQLGITDKEKIYNLLRDLIQSKGLDVTKYINAPPDADLPKITAEEAMGQMTQGIMPDGVPAEGAQVHLKKLEQFAQDPRYQQLLQVDPAFQLIFQTYKQQVQQKAVMDQVQAQLAQQFAGAMGGGGQDGSQGQVDPMAGMGMQPQGPGQVMDEGLPGAKGQMQ